MSMNGVPEQGEQQKRTMRPVCRFVK